MCKRNNERIKVGAFRAIIKDSCAREVWKLISLLEDKYQAYLHDVLVDYVKTGRRERFGSVVLQNIYDRAVRMIDSERCCRNCRL